MNEWLADTIQFNPGFSKHHVCMRIDEFDHELMITAIQ